MVPVRRPVRSPDGVGTARLHRAAEVPMRTTSRLLTALLGLAAAAPARPAVVEASSNTMVIAGQ